MNRRVILRGAAGAAVVAPFLGSARALHGQSTTAPRRLVVFFTHNGCITDKWWPAYEDGPLAADTFVGTTLEPLQPFYQKLLMPRGFRSMNAFGTGQSIDPHDQAMGSKLTCATIGTDSNRYATAESLDHTIAKQINRDGVMPLVLSVGKASSSIKEVLSFSGPGSAFPASTNPMTVYQGLTGLAAAPDGSYDDRQKKSVLDAVRDDLATLSRFDMSQADRQKLDAWQDLLRETEVGMGTGIACDSTLTAELTISNETLTRASTSDSLLGVDLATAFTRGGDMMMNLMTLALACDVNRSLILSYPGYVTFNWDGIAHTRDHSGLSNRTGDGSVGGRCLDGVIDQILQIDAWYAGKYARLVGLLDSLNEGDGRTLLDNTATLWLQELSDGAAHNLNNLPLMIAGGCGGYLKQGYAVNVEGMKIGLGHSSESCRDDGSVLPASSIIDPGGNVPINKLYVTLMNAVGCKGPDGGKVTTFGQFDGMTTDSGITNPGEVAALTAAG